MPRTALAGGLLRNNVGYVPMSIFGVVAVPVAPWASVTGAAQVNL